MAITVSVLQGGTNSHATTSEEVNFLGTDFVSEGVVGAVTNTSGVAPMTGAFAVNAQGTPDMTVAVSSGVAYVTATPTSGNSQLLRVKNSASSNVTIAANSTGGTRYDWIYIKIDPDKAKDPNSGASDVATLETSRSTSSSVDNGTPPTYSYPIAVVTVANGASSITNGNIADTRRVTGAVPGTTDVDYTKAAAGFCVQETATTSSAVATGTTLMVQDDTIPQNTEGNQWITLAITPKATTHRLVIEAIIVQSHGSASTAHAIALFQDSTANALNVTTTYQATSTGLTTLILRHEMAAGTTSSTTFKIRGGCTNAGTVSLNGVSGARVYGGTPQTSLVIREYKA